jgi:Rrf2 family protein
MKKFNYALTVLGSVSQCTPNRPVTVSELSRLIGLSLSYVETLISALRSAGYVTSIRGPGGGYLPGPQLSSATVGDVYNLFSNDELALGGATQPISTAHEAVDEISRQMKAIEQDFFQNYPLAKLANLAPKPIQVESSPISGFKFRPVPPALRPNAPNSVFDMARFRQSKKMEVLL